MNDCGGSILGVHGSNLAYIQKETRAKIQVTQLDNHFSPEIIYSIVIIGNRTTFKQGLIQIMDNIENQIKLQYKTGNPTKCYRNKTIEKGYDNVSYVKGQLPPNPQTVFLDNHRTPPDYVVKNSAVLAPYQGYLFQAKVLSVFRAD